MSVKIKSILTIVFSGIAAVFLFLPGMFKAVVWFPEGWGMWRSIGYNYVSLVRTFNMWSVNGFLKLLILLILAAVAGAIVFSLLQLVTKNKRWGLPATFLPAVALVLLALLVLLYSEMHHPSGEVHVEYELAVVFYLELIALIAATAIALIGFFTGRKRGATTEAPSAADELK